MPAFTTSLRYSTSIWFVISYMRRMKQLSRQKKAAAEASEE
jgi:hypothetical protein